METTKQRVSDCIINLEDLEIKANTSLRTATRLNNIVIKLTTENFKDNPEYERIQKIFDTSLELEAILKNLKSNIDSINSLTDPITNII